MDPEEYFCETCFDKTSDCVLTQCFYCLNLVCDNCGIDAYIWTCDEKDTTQSYKVRVICDKHMDQQLNLPGSSLNTDTKKK